MIETPSNKSLPLTKAGFAEKMTVIQRFIVNHPWVCIVFTLLLIGLAGSGLNFATFNNDPRAMFAEGNEGLALLEELEDRFTKDESVIIIVAPKNGDIFTRRNLEALEKLTQKAWTVPKTLRVDSIINFQHTQVEGDDLNVIDLIEAPATLSDVKLQHIKDIALNEPNLVHNVISPTGHVAAVTINVLADQNGGRDSPMIMAYVESLREEFRNEYPDIEFMLSGQVAFHQASQATTEHELSTTSIYSSLAIMFCLFVMLRSVLAVLLTFFVIATSNIIALGTIAWLGVEFTPVMGGAPAIILTLAVADCIHILITYQQHRRSGLDKREAMFQSLRVNMQPVFLTSITTAIGFLFLNSSESPPFADMANMVSIGVMAAWFLSMVFLPALVMVLPDQQYGKEKVRGKWMDGFARFIIRRKNPVFFVSSLLFGVLALCSLNNEFNDVWLEYFDESYEVRTSTEFMIDELTGHHRIQFALPSGSPSGIMDPEYMTNVDKFVGWAREQQGVVFVSSFSDTIKRLNRDMNGGNSEFYRIPEQRDLISQYALMFQISLPFGLGLENQIDISQSSTRVDVLLGHVSSNDILVFEQEAQVWIAENLPAQMKARGVGFDLLLGELSYQNGQGMLVGTALALIVVSCFLIVALRSVKYGFLSMLPNLFPALISFGIWALIDGQIGISVSIVACMTLGIVIDNTVHFLSKYTRAKDELLLSTVEATRYAFNTVGIALIATTLVIAANFGIMSTSHYYPNASMGLLTAITVGVALAVNFFFFVPVLLFIDTRKERKQHLMSAERMDSHQPMIV